MIQQLRNSLEKYPTRAFLFCWLSTFLFLLLRAGTRFTQPMLWAEDGSIFLTQAYQNGLGSLLETHGGYFHLLPRMMGYLLSFADAEPLPVYSASLSLALHAALISVFCLPAFSYLFASTLARIGIVLLLCLSPGLEEVVANPTNIHWVIELFLGFWGLRSLSSSSSYFASPSAGSLVTTFFLFVCVGSTGASIVFLPLFVIRSLCAYKSGARLSQSIDFWMCLFILFWNTLGFLKALEFAGEGQTDLLRSLSTIWHAFLGHSLFIPWWGFDLSAWLSRSASSLYWIWAILSLGLLIYSTRKNPQRSLWIWLFYGSFLAVIALMTLVRHEVFMLFDSMHVHPSTSYLRYGFILGPASILLWLGLLSQLPPKLSRLLIGLFACCYIVSKSSMFFIPGHEGESWQERIDFTRKTQCPTKDSVLMFIEPQVLGFGIAFPPDRICK